MALTDNLVSYWALDEASGSRADSHGSNTLTDNNTVGSATGKIGTAADFEAGNSEYLSIADNADLSMGDIDFTVQAWVQLESKAGTSDRHLVGKWSTGSYEYLLYYYGTDDQFLFIVTSHGDFGGGHFAQFVRATNFGSPSTGTWYCLHGWHDSVNDLIGIAVNAGTPNTESYPYGVFNGTNDFRIGVAEPGVGSFHDGLLDECAIWKRVLTSQDRTDLYNGGAGLAYPFSGGGGVSPLIRPLHIRQAVNRSATY